jgi:PAB-dependent poly(A)-specific ribonuclease subunit 2
VGHGLTQDFLTVNLVVPPDQIIDTVEIYHQDRMRWISLRFLTNYVFGRDMQQDVHDSIEDARAAYELYLKAIELKKQGTFGNFMQELYVYGAARDWKLGIGET